MSERVCFRCGRPRTKNAIMEHEWGVVLKPGSPPLDECPECVESDQGQTVDTGETLPADVADTVKARLEEWTDD